MESALKSPNVFNSPVLVTGLPRCGTTTITATLATHPDLTLYKSGQQADRLECAELLPEGDPDFGKIRELHGQLSGTRLLIKRPWLHWKHQRALRAFVETTGARIIIGLRDVAGMQRSWEGRGRHYLTEDNRKNLTWIYTEAMGAAFILEREGLACTTWLPFLSEEKRPTELRRLEVYAGLSLGQITFRSIS